MDIYALKNDALGYWKDAEYYLKQQPENKRYKQQARTGKELYLACENATSVATKDLEQELEDNLFELSLAEYKRVKRLIRELGY